MSDATPSSDASSDASGDEDSGKTQRTNWLEWSVFALGVLITAGVVGYLGYQMIWGSDEPAELKVTLQEPKTVGETVFIPLEVENMGDRVAEEAVIEVCAGEEACSMVTFTFIPKGSARTGTVGLDGPLAETPDSRVVSYRTL
ncbi:hypothetical protein [Rubricoccus marinus]|uniref:TIGR02588 family protein n=1 Tax=Rubricoccus marinus TaxID=716817 RepID=A0A259U1V3_9BACT|nr:hypothetical protein [Rubricoccus marinus]OZC03827.1 hypothetical protein BSZ36_13020 [Rubricoccus marinus]